MQSYFGYLDVPLSSIKVDPLFLKSRNLFKVEGLKEVFKKRFDPSQLCITVRPVELAKFDSQNPSDNS